MSEIKQRFSTRALLLTATAVVLTPMGAAATAQTTALESAAEETGRGQDIIVTAQRRAERLQDVPISVSVVSDAQLARQNIDNVTDLTANLPGFTAVQSFSQADLKLGLRGVSELIPALSVDPAVGVYVDGVYYQLHSNANVAMTDVERVEVLYGPQGTLFGRNTLGGALNITTKKPTDNVEGSLLAGIGNYKSRKLTGVINLPLSDAAAIRMVYDHDEHGGYGRNTLLDTPLNSFNQEYLRGTLRLNVGESTEILLGGFYQRANYRPTAIKLDVDPATPLNATIPRLQGGPTGDLLSNYAGGGYYDPQGYNDGNIPLEIFGLTGTVTKEFGGVTFKSISSYSTTDYTSISVSGTPYQLLEIPSFSLKSKQYSQDFQLFGASDDSRFTWTAGVYYYGQKGEERNQLVNFPPLGTPLGRDRRDGPEIDNASYAAYAQATYEIFDKLKLTAGLRYTKDTRETTYHSAIEVIATKEFVNCTLGIVPTPTTGDACQITYKGKYDYLPWTLGLDYKPSRNVLLYAKISQGYRSGAASSSGPSAANIAVFGLVEPESLISPEIGAKIGLFGNRLQLNSAIFYSKYKNIQQNQVQTAPTGQVSVLRNVGVADVWGGEFSANARIEKLDLRLSLAVVEPKYTSGPSVGQPFLNTNKYSWSVGGEYPIDVTVGTLRIGGDYSWRSRLWFFPPVAGNARQNAAVSQSALGLTNAHVALDLADQPVTINAWVQNLFARKFQAAALDLVPAGLGTTLVFAGQPRTYGITASYKFGNR